MGKCVVTSCKNRSGGNDGDQKNDVYFFRFPKDIDTKLEWLKVIKKPIDWIPSKHTRICSAHFEAHLIHTTAKGLHQLHPETVPTLNLPKTFICEKSTQTDPLELGECLLSAEDSPEISSEDTSARPLFSMSSNQEELSRPSTSNSFHSESSSSRPSSSQSFYLGNDSSLLVLSDQDEFTKVTITDTPRERQLKSEISRLRKISAKKGKMIKSLHQNKRRLKMRVTDIKTILDELLQEKINDEKINLIIRLLQKKLRNF